MQGLPLFGFLEIVSETWSHQIFFSLCKTERLNTFFFFFKGDEVFHLHVSPKWSILPFECRMNTFLGLSAFWNLIMTAPFICQRPYASELGWPSRDLDDLLGTADLTEAEHRGKLFPYKKSHFRQCSFINPSEVIVQNSGTIICDLQLRNNSGPGTHKFASEPSSVWCGGPAQQRHLLPAREPVSGVLAWESHAWSHLL